MVAKTVQRISVRIDWTKDEAGKYETQIIMGSNDFFSSGTAIRNQIKQFKRKYLDFVKKAQDIMPKNKSERKSSHFWKIGELLYNFNKEVENEFFITNYAEALMRDFEYFKSPRTIAYILELGKFFKRNEISDSIPITLYLELLQKRNAVQQRNLFEKEKSRLLKLAKEKKLPIKMEYRNQLKLLIKSASTKKMRSVKC